MSYFYFKKKGIYIAKMLRMGKGINVPKLGFFTFLLPDLTLPVKKKKKIIKKNNNIISKIKKKKGVT